MLNRLCPGRRGANPAQLEIEPAARPVKSVSRSEGRLSHGNRDFRLCRGLGDERHDQLMPTRAESTCRSELWTSCTSI